MNDGFDFGSFMVKLSVAFVIAFIGVLAFFLNGTLTKSAIDSGAINMTAWSPLAAQANISLAPLSLLIAPIVLVIFLFFGRPKAVNPYIEQMKQQYEAQQMLQKQINKQQARNNKTAKRQ